MVSIRYTEEQGWHDAQVMPRGPLTLDPATAVLHYAQEIFEGLKAYRLPTTARWRCSASKPMPRASTRARAAWRWPSCPRRCSSSGEASRRRRRDWFPPVDGGALYLRPFMFASEVFLGVKPAAEYHFLVITSPVGNYFKSGAPAISLWVSEDYTRAAPGGTGAAKCGGNYASSLVAQREAIAKGHDQVVFLDAAEHRWIEELGGMNMFFVFDDGSIVTPPLTGTILPGITRDAIITLARDAGLTVREEPYAIDQWQADAESGKLTESFACGTAAVVTPVGKVTRGDTSFTIGAGGPGQVTTTLKDKLVDIQRGRAEDPHGWVTRL
jgi:branched-chain amino acid aminotransferase